MSQQKKRILYLKHKEGNSCNIPGTEKHIYMCYKHKYVRDSVLQNPWAFVYHNLIVSKQICNNDIISRNNNWLLMGKRGEGRRRCSNYWEKEKTSNNNVKCGSI